MIHRDIKLENILIDNLGQVKICDFGVSKLLPDETATAEECCGTPAYMAPEVVMCGVTDQSPKKHSKSKYKKELLEKKPYGMKADIWSAGVVLYTLLYGHLPFRGNTP